MMKFAIFVCLIVANLSFAEESPNPSPSPGEKSQPVQNPSPKENQKTNTPDAPSETVSPTNLQSRTPIGNQDIHNSSNQPNQPPSDNRIVWLTLGLLVVGGIQAFIYARQAYYDDVFGERYEAGSLATYDYRVQQFRVHEDPGYNYNRKKNA